MNFDVYYVVTGNSGWHETLVNPVGSAMVVTHQQGSTIVVISLMLANLQAIE
jgi:DNA-binding beta-propeller fold protein YncE